MENQSQVVAPVSVLREMKNDFDAKRKFQDAFETFLRGAAVLVAQRDNEHFKTVLTYDEGRRYMRVWSKQVHRTEARPDQSRGSAWCFVDKTTGDVLKPASVKAPAKHARGNVFDASNGLGKCGEYGPAYLK